MKKWFKKSFAYFITVVTLGAITPATYVEVDAKTEKNDVIFSEAIEKQAPKTIEFNNIEDKIDFISAETSFEFDHLNVDDYFVRLLTVHAKDELKNKLGEKIYNKLEDELETWIFPKMEEKLYSIVEEEGIGEAEFYWIKPSNNFGEKIFTVYDERTNKEIARFDVSRIKRPKEGYWFCFHYHMHDDNFEKHHYLGDVFWDKNMPPKWNA